MDYRWDSTAHTRAGWHCVCKYVLRMSSLRCQICVEQKSKFMFFLFCYCRLTLWYLVFQEKSSGTVQCNNKQKADRNKCTMPALSDTVSSSYRLLRDYPLSGVMWSQGAGFNSPGECCWKSPGIILPKQSGAPKCETPGAQITGGCSHMWGFKYKGGNNIIGLEPASVSTEGLLDGCIMHLNEFQ